MCAGKLGKFYSMQKVMFNHFNINVSDIETSAEFYERALGLKRVGNLDAPDGSYKILYLGDGSTSFRLELTWLRDKVGKYDLGDNESHLCLRVSEDYAKVHAFHKEMGCVCYENTRMGLYFIHDPDDYWIEILPEKK